MTASEFEAAARALFDEAFAAKRQAEEAARAVDVVQERLRQSMAREADLSAQAAAARDELARARDEHAGEAADLRRQLDAARAEVARMGDHPDVKAARAAQLRQQLASVQAEIDRIDPPAAGGDGTDPE